MDDFDDDDVFGGDALDIDESLLLALESGAAAQQPQQRQAAARPASPLRDVEFPSSPDLGAETSRRMPQLGRSGGGGSALRSPAPTIRVPETPELGAGLSSARTLAREVPDALLSSGRSVVRTFQSSSPIQVISSGVSTQRSPTRPAPDAFDDDDDASMWDDSMLEGMNALEESIQGGGPAFAQAPAAAGPSNAPRPFARTSSTGSSMVQRNLFGGVAAQPPAASREWDKAAYTRAAFGGSSAPGVFSQTAGGARPGGTRAAKTKQWDRTAYAKSGFRYKSDVKAAKRKQGQIVEEDEDEVQDDWDGEGQYQEPDEIRDVIDELQPMKLQIDEEAAKTFIYPTNKELRDYQFNIVKRALFSNTLVALPTGLGKTFIAAVVILNYFNWFPQGKIIFVAPTRPLVSQQQMACHGICGLPWDVAVEMTGATRAALRGDEWESKRIFYMTPQCFQNDLAGSVIDARDVCCVVVDEAHRATGGYAYGNVIRYLTQRNPYFRVLALSATPGNKAEKVQEVVDNLHISNIEIRTEDALDIRKYVHKKLEMPVVVPLGGEVREVQQLWGKMMMTYLEPAHKAHLVHTADPTMVHPFAVRQSLRDPKHRRFLSENKHFYSKLNELASMAQAMQYLTEHSVGMFHTRLLEYEGSKNVEKGGKVAASKKKTMMSDANADYRKIKVLLEKLTIRDGRFSHPKMWYLRDAVTAHFAGEREQGRETRVMVFCSWRECVTEIVDYLNDQDGTDIRATQFIGQSADRQGRKGFKQSDQELVIHQFKKGFFNVIVATSIGEEGLDIGEIDLIVCYEAVKDSVRMLQRVGRTGRKRDGKIIVLMSEGREEKLWQQSKDNYKAVQQGITTGLHLELFDDVPRLVPQHITPTADMRDVEQPEFNPDIIRETTEANRKKKGGKKAPKKAKKAKTMREVPENALTSFVKASALKKGKAKTKASSGARRGEGSSRIHGSGASATASSDSDEPDEPPPKALALSDDSDDEMLARGLRPPSPKARAPAKKLASSPALSEAAGSAQRGSAAGTPDSSRPRGRKLGMGVRRMPSSFVPASEVRRATTSAMGPPQSTSRPAPQRKASLPEGRRGGSDSDTDDSDIEFLPGPPPAKAVAPRPRSPSPVLQAKRKPHPLVAALAASAEQDGPEDDELDAALAEHEMLGHDEADAAVSPPSADAHDSFDEFADEPDFDESVLAGLEQLSAARKQGTAPAPQSSRRSLLRHEGAVSPGSPLADKRSIASRIASSARLSAAGPSRKATPASPEESPFVPRVRRFVRSPRRSSPAEDDDEAMPPPLARPVRRFRRAIEDDESTGAAESSRAGAAGANGARGAVPAVIITAKRRADGAAEKRTKRAKRKRIGGSPTSRMLFRNSAERDTDEEVHGERDEDDEGLHTEDDADSSDREHVGDFEPTQAPRNVNMRAIYQQSLLTQGATDFGGPPRRRWEGHGGRYGIGGRAWQADPPTAGATSDNDEYERDSWCASDGSQIEVEEITGSSQPDRSSQ